MPRSAKSISTDKDLCVYQWGRQTGYLFWMTSPESFLIPATIGESHTDVLSQVPPAVRVFAFHIDLTHTERVPLGRKALCDSLRAAGVLVLNEHVTNISKHAVQRACAAAGLKTTKARRNGNAEEMLIVKTSLNYGGENERMLAPVERRMLNLTRRMAPLSGHLSYRILPRRKVHARYWSSPVFIVERYIVNNRYLLYRAHVCRNRMVISRFFNLAPIKKMPPVFPSMNWYIRLPELISLPAALPMPVSVARAVSIFCRAFRLDFGAVDILLDDDGECYIIDVNTTPHWGERGGEEFLEFLAEGLRVTGAQRTIASSSP